MRVTAARLSTPVEVTIVDSSVLIALASIGQFELLRELYDVLVVPGAVYSEVSVRGAGRAGDEELRSAIPSWIQRVTPTDVIPRPYRGMRQGEIEVISYGVQLTRGGTPVRLLLDDRPGRRRAVSAGLPITGTLGILKCAKGRRLVSTVKRPLGLLLQLSFRARRSLAESVLRQVNEI